MIVQKKIKGKYSEKEKGKQNLTPKASTWGRGIPKNNQKGRSHITNWSLTKWIVANY